MDQRSSCPVLAIDGGGTRCRVASFDGTSIVSVETGPANVTTNFDASVREISAGLKTLAKRVGVEFGDLCQRPAFVGLAGVIEPAMADRLRAALPFQRIRVADDRPAALRGALGDGDGVLAHCGTGSFFGVQLARVQNIVGGWGPVLGDEASAQWIGRTALARTLQSVDGTAPRSDLTKALLDEFGGAPEIVRFAGKATPAEFGALARHVTRAATRGDVVAVDLMQDGADAISTVLRKIGWHSGLRICLTGGIGPEYASYLPEDVQEALSDPLGTPIEGAISLACDMVVDGPE